MDNTNQDTMEEQWDYPNAMDNTNQDTVEEQWDYPNDMDNTNQGTLEAWHIVLIVLGGIITMLFWGSLIYLRCKRLQQRQLLLLSISCGDHARPGNIGPSNPATVSPRAKGNASGRNAPPQPSFAPGPPAYTPNAPPCAYAPDNSDKKTLVDDDKLQNNYSQGYY